MNPDFKAAIAAALGIDPKELTEFVPAHHGEFSHTPVFLYQSTPYTATELDRSPSGRWWMCVKAIFEGKFNVYQSVAY